MAGLMSEDIFSQYFDETKDHINQIINGILSLEKKGFNTEIIDTIYRHTHSIKGISKVVGMNEVISISHKIEDLLEEIKNDIIPVEKETINLLLEYHDLIDSFLKIKSEKNEIDESAITEKLKELSVKEESLKCDFAKEKSNNGYSTLLTVMTEYQEEKYFTGKKEGYKSYEVIIFFKEKGFPKNFERFKKSLNDAGEIIAVTGSKEALPKGFDLAFSILFNSKENIDKIKDVVKIKNIKIREILISPGTSKENNYSYERKMENNLEEAIEEDISLEDEDKLDEELKESRKAFIDECLDELVTITQHIISLESESNNKELVNEVFRAFHSLKGTGGTFKLIQISKIAHELETIMDLVRKEKIEVSSSIIDLLLEGVDNLSDLLSNAQKGKLKADKEFHIIEKIHNFLSSCKKDSDEIEKRENGRTAQPAEPIKKQEIQTQKVSSSRESETIRVKLNKLDHLVNVFQELILFKNTEEYNLKSVERLTRLVKKYIRKFQNSKETLILNSQSIYSSEDGDYKSFLYEIDNNWKEIEKFIEDIFQNFQDNISRGQFLIDELQEEVLNIRMLPVSTISNQYHRLVRDLSQKKKKNISLEITGGGIELDKLILEEINDSVDLMVFLKGYIQYMVRNNPNATIYCILIFKIGLNQQSH